MSAKAIVYLWPSSRQCWRVLATRASAPFSTAATPLSRVRVGHQASTPRLSRQHSNRRWGSLRRSSSSQLLSFLQSSALAQSTRQTQTTPSISLPLPLKRKRFSHSHRFKYLLKPRSASSSPRSQHSCTAQLDSWKVALARRCSVRLASASPRAIGPLSSSCPPRPARVWPNLSLSRSTNGWPPGPVCQYAVNFRQPGPAVPPSAPGQLERWAS